MSPKLALSKAKDALVELNIALNELSASQSTPDREAMVAIEQLGQLTAQYRRDHKLKKSDMALLAGVTHVTLKKFEDDPAGLRVGSLLAILASMGMTLYAGPTSE